MHFTRASVGVQHAGRTVVILADRVMVNSQIPDDRFRDIFNLLI